jgi:UDP-glucose 4-epimerase
VPKVLVTGAAGTIGQAVTRRLLDDPDWEIRASDQREMPEWIAASAEVHSGDLRDRSEALRAAAGCDHVIHLAAIVGGIANFHQLPYTLTDVNSSLYNGVIGAAVETGVERFVYVSSSMVFENAQLFPTPESYLPECPVPTSAYGFSKLAGEHWVRAAHDEHGLPFTICRPFNAYGPGIAHAVPDLIRKCLALPSDDAPLPIFGDGTHTRTLTHVDDIADGIVTAMAAPAGLNEDFNISAGRELTVAQIAEIIWNACGRDPGKFALETGPSFEVDVVRRWPDVSKAEDVLGWKAKIEVEDGVADTVAWLRATL